MRNLRSVLSGRVSAISRRVVVTDAQRRTRKGSGLSAPPGFGSMSAKLARASEQVRGARHGRRTS